VPVRRHAPDIQPSYSKFPSAAERQAEIERILDLLPGELAPERVARRARLREAQVEAAVRESYRACGIDTLDRAAVTKWHPVGKE